MISVRLSTGFKRLKVEELDTVACAARVANCADNTSVDGVLVLSTGGVGGEENHILSGEWAVCTNALAVDSELVRGQRTRLIRAKNGDGGKLLNGRDTRDDGLILGELLSPRQQG